MHYWVLLDSRAHHYNFPTIGHWLHFSPEVNITCSLSTWDHAGRCVFPSSEYLAKPDSVNSTHTMQHRPQTASSEWEILLTNCLWGKYTKPFTPFKYDCSTHCALRGKKGTILITLVKPGNNYGLGQIALHSSAFSVSEQCFVYSQAVNDLTLPSGGENTMA